MPLITTLFRWLRLLIPRQHRPWLLLFLAGLSLPMGFATLAAAGTAPATPLLMAQAAPTDSAPDGENAESAPEIEAASDRPQARAEDPGEYVLEFNRSPLVGNQLRLEGIYDETRLRFTRPRNWTVGSVKLLLRFRHSAALYATRSNLNILINDTSIGSVPLNLPQGEIGDTVLDVPVGILQDYNELTITTLQNNSPTCTQDALDPSLWTEILPDSKLVFDFEPQPVALDFNQYPYPIFDDLSLTSNQVAYLQPEAVDDAWLSAAAQFQAALGRFAEFRPLDSRVTTELAIQPGERLVIVGTPATQPALADLDLPLEIVEGQLVDENGAPLPDETGALMLTTTPESERIALVVTGNSDAAVVKAARFLAQPADWQIATGYLMLVNEVSEVPSPDPRDWPRYLPSEDEFQLADLTNYFGEPMGDVTVRGSQAPALEFDFRARPDDRFLPNNTMMLEYSYGPQVNPLTSLVEVQLDGVGLEGDRLTSVDGAKHKVLKVALPGDKITPQSKIRVNFQLDPRERRSCSRVTDAQLWGTIHAETRFDLSRELGSRIPDLKLLKTGYPFAAPQDLSSTALVLPDQPSTTELELMLEFAERLGRLSQANSIQLAAYRVGQLPSEVRDSHHLVGIGTQASFPLPEAFAADGFKLDESFSREWQQSKIQTIPDREGLIKQVLSPWNDERVLMALSAQIPEGLRQTQQLLAKDPLFYQMRGDTALIKADTAELSEDPNDYTVEFLTQAPAQTDVIEKDASSRLRHLFRTSWIVLTGGVIAAALLVYGVLQLYLKRYRTVED